MPGSKTSAYLKTSFRLNRRSILLSSISSLALLCMGARATGIKAESGTIVVNGSPGTSPDLFARELSRFIQMRQGTRFIVENKQGAGGLLAARHFLSQAPSNLTLMLANSGLICNLPFLSEEPLPFNTQKDFKPIAIFSSVPFFLVTGAASPIKQLSDLRNFGDIQYATSTLGSAGHIVGEMLFSELGIPSQPIPYNNNSQGVIDVASNRIPLGIFSWGSLASMISASKLLPLCTFSAQRAAFAPHIKTAVELGHARIHLEGWQGLFARHDMEIEQVDQFERLVREWVDGKDFTKTLLNSGYNMLYLGPKEARKFIASEIDRYKRLIRDFKISI